MNKRPCENWVFSIQTSQSARCHTPVNVLEDIIQDIDMVLVMSVNPGFGGQNLLNTPTKKSKKVRQMANSQGLNTLIEIDGGVNQNNAKKLIEAGASCSRKFCF